MYCTAQDTFNALYYFNTMTFYIRLNIFVHLVPCTLLPNKRSILTESVPFYQIVQFRERFFNSFQCSSPSQMTPLLDAGCVYNVVTLAGRVNFKYCVKTNDHTQSACGKFGYEPKLIPSSNLHHTDALMIRHTWKTPDIKAAFSTCEMTLQHRLTSKELICQVCIHILWPLAEAAQVQSVATISLFRCVTSHRHVRSCWHLLRGIRL